MKRFTAVLTSSDWVNFELLHLGKRGSHALLDFDRNLRQLSLHFVIVSHSEGDDNPLPRILNEKSGYFRPRRRSLTTEYITAGSTSSRGTSRSTPFPRWAISRQRAMLERSSPIFSTDIW